MAFMNKKPPSNREPRLSELLPIFDKSKNDGKSVKMRLFGPIIAYEFVWFTIQKKDGSLVKFPKLSLDLDPYTDTYISDNCPFRKDPRGQSSRVYLVNSIIRREQDMKPAKLPKLLKAEREFQTIDGFDADVRLTTKDSESWTPVEVMDFSAASAGVLAELEKENLVKGEAYGCEHIDYGFDISFKYNSKGTGTGKVQITRASEKRTPITDEELEYLYYKLDVLKLPSLKAANEDYRSMKEMIVDRDKGSTAKGGTAAKSRLEEDEEEDDIRNKGNIGKLKRPSRDDDDDEDDMPKKKKKKRRDDDEDLD